MPVPRLVATDLDGTLLTPEQQVGTYTRGVLQRVHAAGHCVVFATGRHHLDVLRLRDAADVPVVLVTSNGARVHDETGALVHRSDVPAEAVPRIVELVKDDATVTCHIFRDDGWQLNKADAALDRFLANSPFRYTHFDVDAPPTDGIAKVMLMRRDHEHLMRYEDALRAMFGASLTIMFSTPFCLEIMAAGVTKAAALDAVAAARGLTLRECIAFGDGMNDVDMLRAVGHGLVMSNSSEKMRAALPHHEVIGSNAEEAVARYLEQGLLAA